MRGKHSQIAQRSLPTIDNTSEQAVGCDVQYMHIATAKYPGDPKSAYTVHDEILLH